MEGSVTEVVPRNRSGKGGRVALGLVIGLALGTALGTLATRQFPAGANTTGATPGVGVEDREAEAAIRRLYDQEHENLLRTDVAAQEQFLPDDFVVTNPFGMFIDKPRVVERLKADIIKYSRYERGYDYFRRYGDAVIVVGSETVVPAPDANRPDAGQTVRRRFTEVWVRRDGAWRKVVRHASNVRQP